MDTFLPKRYSTRQCLAEYLNKLSSSSTEDFDDLLLCNDPSSTLNTITEQPSAAAATHIVLALIVASDETNRLLVPWKIQLRYEYLSIDAITF